MLSLVIGGVNTINISHRYIGKGHNKTQSLGKLIHTNKNTFSIKRKETKIVCDNRQTLPAECPDLLNHYYCILVLN
jgi:hypothetical protein